MDEPTAAAAVLGIRDGAVVDVGGGTTGISILRDGKVVYTADEATGGTHMTLVLSGYYDIGRDEAEKMKLDASQEQAVFPIVYPVVEKMASIVKRFVDGRQVKITSLAALVVSVNLKMSLKKSCISRRTNRMTACLSRHWALQ